MKFYTSTASDASDKYQVWPFIASVQFCLVNSVLGSQKVVDEQIYIVFNFNEKFKMFQDPARAAALQA